MENKSNSKKVPYVTIGIIVINVIYFLVLYGLGAFNDGNLLVKYGASVPPLDVTTDYYRLLTSAFMHFDLMHLANNMIMLYFVGEYVEDALGRWKYLLCYILCALGGNLISNAYYIFTDKMIVAMGASGAVFGLAGALAYIIIRNKGLYKDLTMPRMIIFLVLCIYSGVSNSGVNNAAHVGGLITGFLFSLIFYHVKSEE